MARCTRYERCKPDYERLRSDAGVGDVISVLEAAGYDGWYVIEQDVVVESEPAAGHGPVEGQRESLSFLEGIEKTTITG